jgi:hypothetical protein
MIDNQQYLRLQVAGHSYLLPSVQRYSIEQRDNLTENLDSSSGVAAWRVVRNDRWPAYALDGALRLRRPPAQWQRAVYLEDAPHTVGLIVDDVQLLPRGAVNASPFTPLGPTPTAAGHLFMSAWVNAGRVMLVFSPAALLGYLRNLGG